MQGIDLYDGLGESDGGNGVGRIYGHVLRHERIHYSPTAYPGDLVFFHNTGDFNRDGSFNDPLTHVGVVETVEPDGTVLFVSQVSAGIGQCRMNLKMSDRAPLRRRARAQRLSPPEGIRRVGWDPRPHRPTLRRLRTVISVIRQ